MGRADIIRKRFFSASTDAERRRCLTAMMRCCALRERALERRGQGWEVRLRALAYG